MIDGTLGEQSSARRRAGSSPATGNRWSDRARLGTPDQRHRPAEQARSASRPRLEQRICGIQLPLPRLNSGKLRPRISDPPRERRIGRDVPSELRFLAGSPGHEVRIGKRPHVPQATLMRVLEADEGIHRDERLFLPLRAEPEQAAAQLRGGS